MLLISFFFVLPLWVHANCLEQSTDHRVFPAAQNERYSSDDTTAGFILPGNLNLEVTGPFEIDKVMGPAIKRFKISLNQLPDFPKDYEVNPDGLNLFEISTIGVHVQSANVTLYHGVDESYEISSDQTSSSIALHANTVFGALHALETLAQLIEFGWIDEENHQGQVHLVRGIPLYIADRPAFPYRGLLIDTSRHYLPLGLILHNLDVMAMNKMNILHWHIVDDHSFPYRMETYPEISEHGAYHPRRIYTTKEIRNVINQAYLRGIRVVPEFDMPGHTGVIAASHPELMSHCPNPSSPVDPTNPKIYEFVENVYKDLDNLFPDQMVHLGGDEVDFTCWDKDPKIVQFMSDHNMTDSVQVYEYFETRLLRIVDKFGKTPIVWQEVFNLNLTISQNTIVDVWKGFDQSTIEAAVAQGFNVVLSGCWYLDFLNMKWEDFYACNMMNFNGDPEHMLGGHASMWGEHVDASNFMSRVWPRASAVAERLWTGDAPMAGDNIAWRIHLFRCRMVQRGVTAGPTGPGVCPHEVPYHRKKSWTASGRRNGGNLDTYTIQ